jgi:DNA-binding NarL/FixJ family response regulator
VLNGAGILADRLGDYASARRLHEESLDLARELDDTTGVAISLNNLGLVAQLQGDYISARSLYDVSLALKRELGDKRGVAISLSNLGLVELEQGDYTAARSHFKESLTLRRELGDKWGIALSLAGLGGVAVYTGQSGHGARVLAAVESLLEEVGSVLEDEDRLPYERAVAAAREQLGEEAYTKEWAEGKALTLADAITYAYALSSRPEDVEERVGTSHASTAKLRPGGLTRRECEIAALIAESKSNGEIAESLVITKRTVETHITNILSKLSFTSRGQIAAWAIKKGLASHSD